MADNRARSETESTGRVKDPAAPAAAAGPKIPERRLPTAALSPPAPKPAMPRQRPPHRAAPRRRLLPAPATQAISIGPQPSEVAPQIGCFLLRSPADVERRDKTPVLVHEVDHRGVIHSVVGALARHFL